MAIDRSTLPQLRQDALTAFENQMQREPTRQELERIIEDELLRGAGLFCMPASRQGMRGPLVAFSIQGPEYGPDGKLVATGGGLFDPGETDPKLVALRELSQEVVDDRNVPVIRNVKPDDMESLYTSWDFSALKPEAPPEYKIVQAEVFASPLDNEDTTRINKHHDRLLSDRVYAEIAFSYMKGVVKGLPEIGGMMIKTLADAVHASTTNNMRHRHERIGLGVLGQKLLPH